MCRQNLIEIGPANSKGSNRNDLDTSLCHVCPD